MFIHYVPVHHQSELGFVYGNWALNTQGDVRFFWVGPSLPSSPENDGYPIEESPLMSATREEIWEAINDPTAQRPVYRDGYSNRNETIVNCLRLAVITVIHYGYKNIGIKYTPEFEQQAFMVGRAIQWFYENRISD